MRKTIDYTFAGFDQEIEDAVDLSKVNDKRYGYGRSETSSVPVDATRRSKRMRYGFKESDSDSKDSDYELPDIKEDAAPELPKHPQRHVYLRRREVEMSIESPTDDIQADENNKSDEEVMVENEDVQGAQESVQNSENEDLQSVQENVQNSENEDVQSVQENVQNSENEDVQGVQENVQNSENEDVQSVEENVQNSENEDVQGNVQENVQNHENDRHDIEENLENNKEEEEEPSVNCSTISNSENGLPLIQEKQPDRDTTEETLENVKENKTGNNKLTTEDVSTSNSCKIENISEIVQSTVPTY